MANLKLTDVEKTYAGAVNVLNHIDLDIQTGELVVFVGPSGCGKSTLLRMIAGLEKITGGTLEIDGQVVNDVPPSQRGIAMVFQSYALYPHMTVYDNMAFGLRLAKAGKGAVEERVREAARMLQLEPLLDRLAEVAGAEVVTRELHDDLEDIALYGVGSSNSVVLVRRDAPATQRYDWELIERPTEGALFEALSRLADPKTVRIYALVGTGEDAQTMADMMSDAWIAFAKTGTPSSELLPEWKPYTTASRNVMELDVTPQLVDDPEKDIRELPSEL